MRPRLRRDVTFSCQFAIESSLVSAIGTGFLLRLKRHPGPPSCQIFPQEFFSLEVLENSPAASLLDEGF
jgi:hypothetical protein